jgi:hypothetical protein
MGGDTEMIPDPHGEAARRGNHSARSRDVPLGHALLSLVVAALGLTLVIQSLSPPPGGVELAAPDAPATTSDVTAADRLVSVAGALLLRAEFSVVPDLRAGDAATAFPGRASVTTGLFGSSALRPAGVALPSPTSQAARVGVSGVLWAAYEMAARRVPASCHVAPSLLAAIGEVESGSLAGRRLDADHNVVPPVLGPPLSGRGVAAIRDTDDGFWDGDPTWDRAVGPMQFIPGTWRVWGSDGSGDGVADPQNVEDAVYSAARYLCAGGRDLADTADLWAAILSYNHSMSYLARVLELMGTIEPGSLPSLGRAPAQPTVSAAVTTPTAPRSSRAPVPTPTSTQAPAPTTAPTPPPSTTSPSAPSSTEATEATKATEPAPETTPSSASTPSPAPTG